MSNGSRQLVVTAYTLTFGGLLRLGGRLADCVGQRRMVLVAMVGFALSSAISGASVDPATLIGARALQGAFGALLSSSARSWLRGIGS